MRLISEIWNILTPAQRRRVLLAQIISLAMALSAVTGVAAIAPFFAVLGNPRLIDTQPWLHWLYAIGGFEDWHTFVAALGLAFIVVVVSASVINALGSLAMNRLALQIGSELQTVLFHEYLSRPYLFHTATHSSTLFNNVVYEVGRFNNGVLQSGFALITSLASGAFIMASVLLVDPVLSIVMLVILATGYTLIYLAVRQRLSRVGQTHGKAWSELGRIVSESFGAIKEILLLRDRSLFLGGFSRMSGDVSEATAHVYAVGQLPRYIMECVAVTALVGGALVLSTHTSSMGDGLGELTFVAFAAYRLLPLLQQVFANIVRISADRSGFEAIVPDLRHARERARKDSDAEAPTLRWPEGPTEEIRFEDVSFRYSAPGPWVIQGINLRIAARTTVGLIGANGSGKTTLMDLIAGLLLPTTGRVQIDGVTLAPDNRAAWHGHVAYVPQNVVLLDASIAENIAFGVPASVIDRRRVAYAARQAQLEEFVGTLADGYDHQVGERGVRLSGGQRQKIGIARALYRNVSVLLLDEATSALDGLTEAELVATLATLRGQCTVIVISHRMSTVRACDMICRLENGRLLSIGSVELAYRSGQSEPMIEA